MVRTKKAMCKKATPPLPFTKSDKKRMGGITNSIPMTRRRYRHKHGYVALREIRWYQSSTRLLIKKLPFQRLVREILHSVKVSVDDMRIQVAALNALHEATEYFLVRYFEQSYLYTLHAKRVTLMDRDIRLTTRVLKSLGQWVVQK